jgi:transposase InsO family protein
MRYRFIAVEKATYPVTVLCRVLGLSKSGFYVWLKRPASKRATSSAVLQAAITVVFQESRGTYGSPRIHAELVAQGWKVSKTRVEREMRKLGLLARRPKKFRITTDSTHAHPVAENALARQFEASRPNQVWTTDITYVWTQEGWLYLSVIIDLFSRRVVGWATANHMRTSLVLNALHMAIGRRLPDAGLLHHSDRGTQYASTTYRDALAELEILCSMSRKGNCWDNAVSESFFSTIKHELIYRQEWETRAAASLAIAEYIECFYNTRRRHSYLGFKSPAEYERIFASRSIALPQFCGHPN